MHVVKILSFSRTNERVGYSSLLAICHVYRDYQSYYHRNLEQMYRCNKQTDETSVLGQTSKQPNT